jgi:ligand-binding sensor domain-containing protein
MLAFHTTLLLGVITAFAACTEQQSKSSRRTTEPVVAKHIGDTVSVLGKNIGSLLQDKNNTYWFASNGDGVYRYDGKTIMHFTDKDGLCSNFVWTIQEDVNGHLWFTTRDGVCRFDGVSFTNFATIIRTAMTGVLHYRSGGLFFGHLNGVCFFDGATFTNFTIHPDTYRPETNDRSRPYSVYCSVADRSGNVWFGTQEKGVCRYDGTTFTYLTEKKLDAAAVRCIFQDREGRLWFGNNGAGLFRYDGITLRNITDEKGLGNPEFLKAKKVLDRPGTLARVWAINEDRDGNLWIGTIDAGVWKFDRKTLTNYTTKDGLSGNSIWAIYKDRKGELLFVTNGDAISTYNGHSFTSFVMK